MGYSILAKVDGRNVEHDPLKALLRWTAGLTIDADGAPNAYGPSNRGLDYTECAGKPGNWWGVAVDKRTGRPYVQGLDDPFPGLWVSTTAYQRPGFALNDTRRYVDSRKIPFVVIPGFLIDMVRPVVLGSYAIVTNLSNGLTCEAGILDIGPNNHLGEGSMALADALKIKSDPRTGGTNKPIVSVEIHLGVPAKIKGEQFSLQPHGSRVPTAMADMYSKLVMK